MTPANCASRSRLFIVIAFANCDARCRACCASQNSNRLIANPAPAITFVLTAPDAIETGFVVSEIVHGCPSIVVTVALLRVLLFKGKCAIIEDLFSLSCLFSWMESNRCPPVI